MMAAHGTFVWFELNTDDVARAKAFYTKALGWTYSEMPGPTPYTIIHSGETMVGGLVANMAPPGTPPHWFDYIEVDDVDERAKGFATAGGEILRAPFDIPTVGRIAVVKDSCGAVMGIMTSAPR
jgi:uncharacterized protein